MKSLIIGFLIFLLAIWVGLKVAADPGYVLIAYHNTSIETTFWCFFLTIFVTFFVLYFLLRIIHHSRVLPMRIQRWWVKRGEKRAIRFTNLGIFKLIEKNWAKSEKYLIKAAKNSPNPFVNYLQAAYVAQKQGDYKHRDVYLHNAAAHEKKSDIIVGLVQAKMQIQSKQLEQALANLQRLRTIRPHHPSVLKLLQEVYLELHDWQNLKNLLPLLRKRQVNTKQEFISLHAKISLELMKTINDANDLDKNAEAKFIELKNMWLSLPRYLRREPNLVSFYAQILADNNFSKEAEQLVKNTLKKVWDKKLLEVYANINLDKPSKQLAAAEKWLDNHPDDPDLLFCLSKLCKKQALWGKARKYLEKLLELSPSKSAYMELSEVNKVYSERHDGSH